MKRMAFLLALFALGTPSGGIFGNSETSEPKQVVAASKYEPNNYSKLLGMKGFSDSLLSMHFKLYEGYVKNTNLLMDRLHQLAEQNQFNTPEYRGLKRMYGWEFDGMRLHEYYFDNLGGKGEIDPNSALYRQIAQQFGSYENWKSDFVATGMIRGIGWSILYHDHTTNRLVNAWINEHDLGHLAGSQPLLVMDVFEHAYLPDYGLDRRKYIEAFFNNIDWDVVNSRFGK